jgi:hypothetical protein
MAELESRVQANAGKGTESSDEKASVVNVDEI